MTETLTLFNSHNIVEMYNFKEKVYSNGLVKLKKYSFDNIKGLPCNNSHNGKSTEKQLEQYLKKRVKERREKIIDIAFSNSWKYFLTLTFDPKNKKYFPLGYSHEQAIKLLTKWLNNQRKKNKDMKYIIVSEFHKESGHLHFHGLFSHVNWSLTEAINPKTNKSIILNDTQIYNLNDYTFGFSTISLIKDSSKVSIYLSKYITKDLISLKNRKVFWHSRNLSIPKVNFKYVNVSLKEYVNTLENYNILFYKQFEHERSLIEVATTTIPQGEVKRSAKTKEGCDKHSFSEFSPPNI